ncbi:serine/threonine protein kinase [Streptomyces purpurogeneiscleroticus]|uniref:serine/threonine protein kinase n=1 Tax=Streptomyces purpurogeneiscleroticus TaxID=68259 RepID=UPI001CBFB94C|nr:serine/threonine protein kinase [Streptomyces purpurogeneiscleroticus]MBZ4017405.1 serine/threonine protein kinase [Streptomyces purpurogeneiscleroticus]
MTDHPLLGTYEVAAVEPYLARVGEVFAAGPVHDSGCRAYGVRLPDGERWCVKEALTDAAQRSLDRGWAFHRAVRHPVIVPHVHRWQVGERTAAVLPWRDGEPLYHRAPARVPGEPRGAALARFRALPVERVLAALDLILDAHLAVEQAGHVAVDFYDGAVLYDFATHTPHLIDLDEYRRGPFVLQEDRLPGSRRFMAPEEWVRGAVIDVRTTVYTLGRTARLLMDAGDEERAWRGTPRQRAVIARATCADPPHRFPSVRQFVGEWRAASREVPADPHGPLGRGELMH